MGKTKRIMMEKDHKKNRAEKDLMEKDFEMGMEKDLNQNTSEKDLEPKKVDEHINFCRPVKLPPNYGQYRQERKARMMPAVERCEKCNNNFEDKDALYLAAKVTTRNTKAENGEIVIETEYSNCILCQKCIKEIKESNE